MESPTRALFIATAALLAASSLSAASVTWDISPGVVGSGDSVITGGDGTWNDSLAGTPNGDWTLDGGANNIAWVNANGDTAVFGGTAGTVTLGNAITAGGLTFNTAGYTITGSTLTFAGATPTILTNANATIASAINTGGLTVTKSGAGALTLNGTTFTGGGVFDVTAGQVTTAGTVALGTTNLTVESGRNLLIGFGSGITGGTITLGAGTQFGLQNGGAGQVTTTSNIVLNAGSGAANAASIGGFIFGNNTTLTGTISGTGDLRWRTGILGGGSNSASLNAGGSTTGWAANSYTGATSFEGVNLNFNLTSTVNNATVTPFGATTNAVTVNGGATLHFNTTGAAGNTSIITNALSFSAADGQTTTLFREDGNLRFTGNIAIATTGTGKVVFQSKWGQVSNKGLQIEGVLSGGGNLSVSRGNDSSEDGAVHLTNNGNTFNGTIRIDATGGNAGRLVLDADGAAANAGLNLAVSGAELNVNTTNASIASLTGVAGSKISARTAGRTLTVNQSADTTFAGVIGGTGLQNTGGNAGINLVKSGSGALTLSGANAYTGSTTVNAGAIITGNTSALGTGAVTLDGGALQIGATGVGGIASLTVNAGLLDTSAGGVTTTGAFALAGGTWKVGAGADTLSAASFNLTGGTIDLSNLSTLNKTTSGYSLISGTGTSSLTNANFSGGDAGYAYSLNATGDLVVTAVPEPSAYGLLGSGALAAFALVRRRKRSAGIAA